MDVRAVLADSPLFAEVDPGVVDALADQAEVVGLRGGERLFAIGEATDAVYVVASGRLRALAADGQVLGEIGRGEPIGEMGVLTDEPHRAAVVAVRDSILLRVERPTLVALFAANPVALLQTVRVIVHRLRPTAQEKRRARTRGQRTVALIPAVPGLDVRPQAQQLVASLAQLGDTALLDPAAVDAALGEGAAASPFEDGPRNERLMTWLADQERQYRYLVYTCPAAAGPWARRCMRQADRVLMVVPSGALPMATVMIDELGQSGSLASRDLLVLRAEGEDPGNVLGWRARINAVTHFYVRPGVREDLHSLARALTGRGVGLVLGGGGARGFAHLGLMRALDELGIPVDAVGGSSMGAFFAALRACGHDAPTMLEIARETFVDNNFLNDYLFPSVALVRGRKFTRRLHDIFGDRQIEDLRLPYFCVSSNLSRGRAEVHDRGPLYLWTATSMAVPGVAPPVVYREDLLVDGALLNSLPTDIMKNLDRGLVVASDVSTGGELRAPGIEGPDPEGLFNWTADSKRPGLFSIMFRTATVTSETARKLRADSADVYLRMPVSGIALFDWKQFDTVIERSYAHAMEQLTPLRDGLLAGDV